MVIVGLGNPGKKFEKTRHNIGFRVIEEFQKKNNFSDFKLSKKNFAEISEGIFNNKKIILAKPQTFMNNSGQSVKKLIENWKLKIENLFVIHDDIDLPLGKIKIVKNRGSAGHKGVQSIIDHLKAKNFVRFRLGIKPHTDITLYRLEKFVLEKFEKEEEKIVKEVIKKTVWALEIVLKEGTEKAMTKFNI